jgi:hypothetical protein
MRGITKRSGKRGVIWNRGNWGKEETMLERGVATGEKGS